MVPIQGLRIGLAAGLLVVVAVGSPAAQRPKPLPKPAPKTAAAPKPPALPGTLLIEVDAPARIEVDDQVIGVVGPEALKRVPVSLGQHVVRATSTDWEVVRARQEVDVPKAGQVVVRLELAPGLAVAHPCPPEPPEDAARRGSGAGAPPDRVRWKVADANLSGGQKLKDVRPVYPPIAQSARVQGAVILQATIGVTGRVQSACVLKSMPLLDQAATTAVLRWEYSPVLLNGVPTTTLMTVTVNFSLQ